MKKALNILLHLINGILFIIMGIIFIVKRNDMFNLTIRMIGVILLITMIVKIINIFVKKKKIFIKLLDFFITLLTGIAFLSLPTLFISLFTRIFGLYALLQSLSSFINLYIYKQDRLRGTIFILFKGLISFVTAWLLLFSPISNSKYLCIITGIYLILYGISILFGMIDSKRKLIIPLPIILTMFLPKILIKRIEKDINYKLINKDDANIDLEILIHLAKNGSASMGHVEIGFDNKIYSYGCYNYMNRMLWGGMGDGILGVFDHDKYIKYCVNEKDRFIISYGISLNNNEKDTVKKYIDKLIEKNTTRWYPEEELFDMGLGEKKEFKEMANQIYKKTNGIFYRFTKGKYKTFFVFRTNCVEIADAILGSLGTKVINLEGVISPGTYYSYLENEYKKKNSKIISKTLYTKALIKERGY